MKRRVGSAMTCIAALAVCFTAAAAEPRKVHIDIGSSRAPLIATVHVEDYRAAPIELIAPATTADSPMTRFMKTYFELGRAGDAKKFASLFGPEVQADADDRDVARRALREHFMDLRSVRLLNVLHWGDFQVAFVAYESAVEKGGTRRWTWGHAVRCVDDACQIAGHYENDLLGRKVAGAFAEKGEAKLAVPPQGETALPILPAVVDGSRKSVTTDPIVLHLNRASEQTTRAVSKAVTELGDVTSVYSLGPDVCVALLISNNVLPLQRTDTGWAIISDPSTLDAWLILSSASTSQALQSR